MKSLVCLLLCALYVLKTTHGQQDSNSGTIMLESSGGTISTRVGCSETLRCTGLGTRISWRVFRTRVDLVNDTSFYIVTKGVRFEGDTTGELFQWESLLVFPSLVVKDSNLYTCNVFDTTKSLAPELVSVQMNVALEAAVIEPVIENRDISSYYVGEQILVGCPVKTCASGITVQFFFNDTIVAEGLPSSTDERVYTMNLPARLDSAGTYTCRLTTDAPGYLDVQSFNITGTPMVRPTDVTGPSVPSSSSPGGTLGSTTEGSTTEGSTTQGNGAPHTTLPAPFISLLLVMATLLCVYRS